MPPAVSDDEESNVDVEELNTAPGPKKDTSKRRQPRKYAEEDDEKPEEDEVLEVEEAEDDEEKEVDEYIVEAIKNHIIDDDGVLRFHVKWQGYEKKSDMTWEPEDNLMESATDIMNEYLESVGGRDFVMNGGSKKDNSKKRGRPSGTPIATTNGKKRKSAPHPKDGSPPAGIKKDFKPPTGSWEEDVRGIDACEGLNGEVMVFLSWSNGHKTQHPLEQVYKRCPQKMLKFYESHLVFKKVELREDEE